MAIHWRAWYDGDRIFDSRGYDWEELPDDGVQLIMVYLPEGERVISGCDWYFKVGDIIAGNSHPPEETKARYPGAVLKRGRWVSDAELKLISTEAVKAR